MAPIYGADKFCSMLQRLSRFYIAFSVLASCGGGGGGNEPGVVTELARLNAMRVEASELVADFAPIEYTDLTSIPVSGSATYEGYISAQLSNTTDDVTDTLIGQLHLNVSFEAGDMVTGEADGFLDDAGASLNGSVVLSQGSLNRGGDPNVDATFIFRGAGDLHDADGRTLTLSTVFEGDFLEDGYTAVGGDILGQVTVEGEDQNLGGLFIGTR